MKLLMRVTERVILVAALTAALSTLARCLPFSFLGALGLAGASVKLHLARPWLLASAGLLLIVDFVLWYFQRKQWQKRSRLSIALFWSGVVIVLLVILFPQLIASLIAG